MRRYFLGVQYIGTRFKGWPPFSKHEDGFRSIWSTLAEGLDTFVGKSNYSKLSASSRTDAGVHAFRNVFSVDMIRKRRQQGEELRPHSPYRVVSALNALLSDVPDLQIVSAAAVDNDLHIRTDAQSRTYEYYIVSRPQSSTQGSVLVSGRPSIFTTETAWTVDAHLDLDMMRSASKLLVGTHDWSSFRNAGCQSLSPIRRMNSLSVEELPPTLPIIVGGSSLAQDHQPRLIKVTLNANAFVYRMCRNIVSALVKVGTGSMTPEELRSLIEAKDRTLAPPSAPAHGLYLKDVHYDENVFTWHVENHIL